MDWMTLAVEMIGIVILCVWIVLPVREFRTIFRRIFHKPSEVAVDRSPAKTEQPAAPVAEILR